MYVCIHIYIYIQGCTISTLTKKNKTKHTHANTHTHTHIYILFYTRELFLIIDAFGIIKIKSLLTNKRMFEKFRADKEKKQKVPRKNNYRRRLRRWHSDSGKYTQPNQNTTALFATSRRWHWPPCQCTQNGIHVHQTGDISTLEGSYRSYGSQTWPIQWNAVFFKQLSYRYCYMDALLGRY